MAKKKAKLVEKHKKSIVSEDTLDIITVYLDALEINYGMDNDELIFSESNTHIPPAYMRAAAKRGITLSEKYGNNTLSKERARYIQEALPLSTDTIKRIKQLALRQKKNLPPNIGESSKIAQNLLLFGIVPTVKGIDRVVKWCDRQIKKQERANA